VLRSNDCITQLLPNVNAQIKRMSVLLYYSPLSVSQSALLLFRRNFSRTKNHTILRGAKAKSAWKIYHDSFVVLAERVSGIAGTWPSYQSDGEVKGAFLPLSETQPPVVLILQTVPVFSSSSYTSLASPARLKTIASGSSIDELQAVDLARHALLRYAFRDRWSSDIVVSLIICRSRWCNSHQRERVD